LANLRSRSHDIEWKERRRETKGEKKMEEEDSQDEA
jgi:hypothetical protein